MDQAQNRLWRRDSATIPSWFTFFSKYQTGSFGLSNLNCFVDQEMFVIGTFFLSEVALYIINYCTGLRPKAFFRKNIISHSIFEKISFTFLQNGIMLYENENEKGNTINMDFERPNAIIQIYKSSIRQRKTPTFCYFTKSNSWRSSIHLWSNVPLKCW